MIRSSSTGEPANATVSIFEEHGRTRKAMLYADIIEAGGIGIAEVERFGDGQWAAVALIASGKPPSAATRAVICALLRQRQAWRERLSLQPE